MALKKSELYSSLWSSCDELRGGMDASQYKDYVLVLLFVKYISDRYARQPYAPITIRKGASFADMVALKGNPEIGDLINKNILGPLAQDNGLSDMPDFNDSTKLGDGKEKVERLTNLIAIFENPALDFSKNRADGDDLLGDAYEYLMRHFATESGKSKGQFYTPAEVSRVIAQVLGIRHANATSNTSVYDPTCGSGSLLLKVADEAWHYRGVKVTLFGQEKDNATAGLARMNVVLHDYATADIKQGNTLANPLFTTGEALQTFDYVVANPPFSDKRWSTGMHPDEGGRPSPDGQVTGKDWGRFTGIGIPPAKQGDYAYLLHILRSMKPNGKGACVLPHGVLFRGNAEAVIRRNLVQRGYIKGIIGLPPNLFYGTGIPACIIVLDKEGANARKGIFMIDASKGFIKDGNKNRLREQDIHKIVDTFARQVDVPRYARLVPVAEIADPKNDYNLNLPRYIDSTEPEDIQDIDGHLRGGIPNRDIDALESYWEIIPAVRSELFQPLRENYSQLAVPQAEIKQTIFGHREFSAFIESVNGILCKWKETNTPKLKAFDKDGRPKALIETVAEDLLAAFRKAPLLDAYDVYQHLMDYWAETMQDDCYLVATDGWREAAQPRLIVEDKNKKTKTRPDLVVGKKKYQTELIPPALIVRRWFAEEQAAVEKLETEVAALEQQLDEMAEEQGGEEGLLSEAANEKGKITKAGVLARLKEVKREAEDEDIKEECKVLQGYLDLAEKHAGLQKQASDAQEKLIEQVAAKYPKLTNDEIKLLVIDDKWMGAFADAVHGELDQVSQTLTGRIRQLAERYATPLPQLEDDIVALSRRVEEHLKKMGAVWK
jgi:type I restriction enzyme M protein